MCLSVSGALGMPTQLGVALGRPANVYLPNNYNRRKKYPVIIGLHGLGENPDSSIAKFLGSRDRARNSGPGVILILPLGTVNAGGVVRFWDASDPCCRLGFGPTIADSVYLALLIEEAIATFSVDRSMIGAFGYSNGAFMANTLAMCRPDLITHVIGLAGVRSLSSDAHLQASGPFFCNPTIAQSVHYTGVHGTLDTVVDYNGDPTGLNVLDVPSGIYLSAQASAEAWGFANGCTGSFASYATADFTATVVGSETTLFRYPSQAINGSVEFASISGADHNPNTNDAFFQYVANRFFGIPRV